ncbi:bidirectional sugar transporter SWEET14-like [Wolffia australiana]
MGAIHHPLALMFGVLGSLTSFMVYLAPVLTFYRICKKRSTEGVQAVPYVITLFSAMLMIYYAMIKTNSFLLITINRLLLHRDCLHRPVFTLNMLTALNIVAYCIIVGLTLLLFKGHNCVRVIGCVNIVFSVCIFVVPLSIIRLVICTKIVEAMLFTLSFFPTLCTVVWLGYGLLIRDPYVVVSTPWCKLYHNGEVCLMLGFLDRRRIFWDFSS